MNNGDLATTNRVLATIRAAQLSGDRRAIPDEIFEEVGKIVVQPCVEVIVVDGGKYCLQRRSKDDSGNFGEGRLHIPGGFLKPVNGAGSVACDARWMAHTECGFQDLQYIAGPVAIYRWPMETHKYANPVSLAYVFEPCGIKQQKEGLAWFDIGVLPDRQEVIDGHGGEVHLAILRVFFDSYKKNFQCPCVDLDMNQV